MRTIVHDSETLTLRPVPGVNRELVTGADGAEWGMIARWSFRGEEQWAIFDPNGDPIGDDYLTEDEALGALREGARLRAKFPG